MKRAITIPEKNHHGPGQRGYREVRFTIAVEIPHGNRTGAAGNWVIGARSEHSRPTPKNNGYPGAGGHGQIGGAIAVKVCRRGLDWANACLQCAAAAKRAVTISQEQGDGVACAEAIVHDRQIGVSIAIEVSHGHRDRNVASGVDGRGLKRAVTISQIHPD